MESISQSFVRAQQQLSTAGMTKNMSRKQAKATKASAATVAGDLCVPLGPAIDLLVAFDQVQAGAVASEAATLQVFI